jgi:hypothetical protein
MDRDPCIPLHPDLQLYALSLLRDNIPLSQLKALCKAWATKHWGEEMGDAHHCYRLNDHDSSSLYHTLARE